MYYSITIELYFILNTNHPIDRNLTLILLLSDLILTVVEPYHTTFLGRIITVYSLIISSISLLVLSLSQLSITAKLIHPPLAHILPDTYL